MAAAEGPATPDTAAPAGRGGAARGGGGEPELRRGGVGGGAAGTDGGLGPVAAAALRPGAPGGRRWRLPGPAAR